MVNVSARTRTPQLLFLGLAVAVYTAAIAVAGLLPSLDRPGAVALGVTVDLVVVVPLAFYLLVVRRRGLPLITLVPIAVIGVVAAARILPADHHRAVRVFEVLVVPLELGLLSWIAWRATSAVRKAKRDAAADPLERLRRAAIELARHDRVASIFATEIGVFYYALGSWRARPHVPSGTRAFTHHQRGGHAGIVLGMLLVCAVEGLAVHFLLAGWNSVVAWVFTIGSVYTAMWVVADYRATVLRPILVDEGRIHFRAGLRTTLSVPRASVVEVARAKPELGKNCLNLTFLGTPTHWVMLAEPMVAHGLYGLRRRVRAVGLEPDDAEAFVQSLRPRDLAP